MDQKRLLHDAGQVTRRNFVLQFASSCGVQDLISADEATNV